MNRRIRTPVVGVVLAVLLVAGFAGWDGSPGVAGVQGASGNPATPTGASTVELNAADSQLVTKGVTYGGNGMDTFRWIVPTDDGGYTLVGFTESFGAGKRDIWVVKVNASGGEEWNRTYGGSAHDWANAAIRTDDGGLFVSGTTESYGAGGSDFWLLKVDANGTEEWNRTYGGSDEDFGPEIAESPDGGYAVLGTTESYGAGRSDVWLVKVGTNGTEAWNRTYGGDFDEGAFSLARTENGGFALAGYTSSFSRGFDLDAWLVKVAENGIEEWNQTYGRNASEVAFGVVPAGDGGFTLIGTTQVSNLRTGWLREVNATGVEEWTREFGGESGTTHDPSGLVRTPDSDYVFVMNTRTKAEAGWSNATASLVTVDAAGCEEGNLTFDGNGNDVLFQVHQYADGSYALVGYTESGEAGDRDGWLVLVENATATTFVNEEVERNKSALQIGPVPLTRLDIREPRTVGQ